MNPWVILLRGIFAFIFGILLVVWPGISLSVVIVLFPIFAILDGTSAIIIGSQSEDNDKWPAFIPMGILEITIGALVLFWPDLRFEAFVFIMALWAFVLGLSELCIAFCHGTLSGTKRWLYGIGGALTLILGILVILYPIIISTTLFWILGIMLIVYGIAEFAIGLSVFRTEKA